MNIAIRVSDYHNFTVELNPLNSKLSGAQSIVGVVPVNFITGFQICSLFYCHVLTMPATCGDVKGYLKLFIIPARR